MSYGSMGDELQCTDYCIRLEREGDRTSAMYTDNGLGAIKARFPTLDEARW